MKGCPPPPLLLRVVDKEMMKFWWGIRTLATNKKMDASVDIHILAYSGFNQYNHFIPPTLGTCIFSNDVQKL